MVKYALLALVFLAVILSTGCSSQSNMNFRFDMQADMKMKNRMSVPPLDGQRRAALPISNAPFCQFSKYEVTVYFVYIGLYNPEGWGGYSKHTLVNLPDGSGIKLDLVTETLSNKVLAGNLALSNAAGNAVDKIYIGLGNTVTVCGYVYSNGVLHRTSASGIIPDDSMPPADCVLTLPGYTIQAYSVDPDHPPLNPNVIGAYLWLASGGRVHGHSAVTLEAGELLSFVFPIDVGIGITMNGNGWQGMELNSATTYVASSTVYRKFYLKKQGATNYTDFIRFLTDNQNRVILGEGFGSSFNTSDPNTILNGGFSIWYQADADTNNTLYSNYWRVNADGSVFFSTMDGSVVASNFQLNSHSGVITVKGTPVAYDCLKVQ